MNNNTSTNTNTNNNNNNVSNASAATITPNTLNAITGVLNSSNTNPAYSNLQNSHPQQQQPQHPPTNAVTSGQENNPTYIASEAASTAANGLFLLSQAHQELTKREEAQARAGNVNGANTNAPNGTVHTNGKRGSKRKSYDTLSVSPTLPNTQPRQNQRTASKRTRANTATNNGTNARARKQSSPRDDDDMGQDDDEDDEDDGGMGPDDSEAGATNNGGARRGKRPETEEEKRKNFLERNRQGNTL
jgi:ATF/CREB family transcription factor